MKLESFNSKKFEKLSENDLNQVNGGGIFPKWSEASQSTTMYAGSQSYYVSYQVHTGWFSSRVNDNRAVETVSD